MTTMSAISPTLTMAGLRAVFNASNDGLTAQITHIALGSSQYTPSGSETALKSEQARIPVAAGRYVDDYNIEVSALLDTDTGFTVAEVGLILEDGTLLAVWSNPDTPLAAYMVGVPIVLACYLAISQLPTDVLSFSGDVDLNLFFGTEFANIGISIMTLTTMQRVLSSDLAEIQTQVASLREMQKRFDALEILAVNNRSRIDALEA
nr:phage tail protein [uncultured Cohaesibacter sp.]